MLQEMYIRYSEVCEMLAIISDTECKEKWLLCFAKKVHLEPLKQEVYFDKKNKNKNKKCQIAYKRTRTIQSKFYKNKSLQKELYQYLPTPTETILNGGP